MKKSVPIPKPRPIGLPPVKDEDAKVKAVLEAEKKGVWKRDQAQMMLNMMGEGSGGKRPKLAPGLYKKGGLVKKGRK